MNSMEDQINSFLKRFWEWRLTSYPEFATSVGIHKYDNRLDEQNINAFFRQEAEGRQLLNEATFLQQNHQHISKQLHFNLDLVRYDLSQLTDGMKFKPYLFCVNVSYGPHTQLPNLLSLMKKESKEDFLLILQRMRLHSQQVDEMISLLEEGIRTGIVMHKASIEKLPDSLMKFTEKNYNESPLYKAFLDQPAGKIDEKTWNQFIYEAKCLIEKSIYPSCIKLADFVRDEYLPKTRDSIGASSLPNGKAYYAACLRFHTTTNLSADEIHNIGKVEVARITERMLSLKDDFKFKGTLKEFKEYLRTNEEFTFRNGDEILTAYNSACERIKSKLPDYFHTIPTVGFQVIPVPPELAPNFTFANYTSPPVDGSGLGNFNINTYKPETRKKYDVVATSLHEAMPGHHLQIGLTMEHGNSPDFRRYNGIKKYYMPPAYFAMNTAYLEGWGLYAEYLGEEMCAYESPCDMIGRFSAEILRACRLVVDTGIHAFGWSREDAVEYMLDNTAFDLELISFEVTRYITIPGQACGYKIGEIRIRELRERAKAKLADKFDLKSFHHTVACLGAVPLDILENQVDLYIREQLKQ